MSLISDALKEAQRERSERSGQPGAPAPVDNFFPLPPDRDRGRPNALLIGGVGAAAIVVASVVWWSTSHLFTRAQTSRHVAATQAPVARRIATESVTAPVALVQSHDSVGAAPPRTLPTPEARPMTSAPRAVASATPAVPGRAPTEKRTLQRATSPRVAESGADTAAATLVSTVTVQPPSAAAEPVSNGSQSARIVIDAPSVRPADSLFKLAYAEHLKGNFDRAKELYEQTIAMQQAPSEAYNDYGVLLSQHGNPTAAAEMFRVAVRRDDANAEAWINLGDSYGLAGHHADALSAFSRAIQLDPGSAAVKIRLAAEYHAIGDSTSARRLYDESLNAAPKDPAVHYEFAKFLQAQQDFRGAAREFQQFVDLAGGKYDARTIDAVRQHVASLEKAAR